MSDALAPTPPPAPPAQTAATTAQTSDLGAIITASWAQAIMAAAMVLAVMKILPNDALLLLLGAVIANAQQAASYFLGSSKSSKDKDATIAANTTALANSVPSNVVTFTPKAAA